MTGTTAKPHNAWQKRFIPERLTPLPFTPAWSALNPAEQLRYNQLHGLFFHEQIIFFEQVGTQRHGNQKWPLPIAVLLHKQIQEYFLIQRNSAIVQFFHQI